LIYFIIGFNIKVFGGFASIGILEEWNTGRMGIEEKKY